MGKRDRYTDRQADRQTDRQKERKRDKNWGGWGTVSVHMLAISYNPIYNKYLLQKFQPKKVFSQKFCESWNLAITESAA